MCDPTSWWDEWNRLNWSVHRAPPALPEFSIKQDGYTFIQDFDSVHLGIERIVFLPILILNLQSENSAWGVLKYVSPCGWSATLEKALQEHCHDMVTEALRLCHIQGVLKESKVTNEFHNLDKEEIAGNIHYAQSCSEVRSA